MLESYVKKTTEFIANNEIVTVLQPDEIVHHAFMLTQYEKYGSVSLSDLDEYLINEIMDDPCYADISEYLDENCYDPVYPLELLNDLLYGIEPEQIVRMTVFGNVSFADDYVTFDGYANLETMTESELIERYGKDTKRYILESGNASGTAADILDDSEIIIETANMLILEGF